jgi:hypothetical protein
MIARAAVAGRRTMPALPAAHRARVPQKLSLRAYVGGARPSSIVALPLIYSALVPFAALDLWTTLYQWTCFPIFGIPRVRRRQYLVIDRQHLGYLNAIEKVHCMYCGYANGLIAYVREVAARTEQYWCPIKHGRPVISAHDRYELFAEYGDAEGYRRGLKGLRRSMTKEGVS